MKMLFTIAIAGLFASGVLYAETSQAPEEKEKVKLQPQTICPIMGGAINEKQYVDHEGKRIFVCCPPCKDSVKADPAAAIATLAEKGQGPGQALCPIMKKMPVSGRQYVDHEGQRIYVCCGGCARSVQANPDAALKTLKEQGVVPAKAEATTEKATEKQQR